MDLVKLKLEFLEKQKLFEELRDVVLYKIQSEIKSNPHTPTKYFKSRIKTYESFLNKITEESIQTISEAFSLIDDVLGIRLISLYKTDLQEICDWVEENFNFLDKKVYLWDGVGKLKPSQEELKKTMETGYTSIHYKVQIKESQKRGDYDLAELVFEIQVRTILEEAWGEFTHEVYKDANAPKFILGSYKILSEYLNIINKQVEFLKTTYKTLTREQITKEVIESVNYNNERILFLNLANFTLKNLKYINCDLFTFDLKDSYLYNVEYNRCRLMNFDFTDSELKKVKFLNKGLGRNLMNFDFRSSRIDESEFKNVDMMNTDFADVICRNTTFQDVELMNTDFFNAEFVKCTFKNVKFFNVFNVEKSRFVECTFVQVDVKGKDAEKLVEKMRP